jgi:hypothetical protein
MLPTRGLDGGADRVKRGLVSTDCANLALAHNRSSAADKQRGGAACTCVHRNQPKLPLCWACSHAGSVYPALRPAR